MIFDSFCYEPENLYEKKLGSLYLAGELKNALPQNNKFLDHLSEFLKKEFYSSIKRSSENSLKDSLKKSNAYLGEIGKKGDVSWLGNLSLAVLNFKDYNLNFAKVGDFKIVLLRSGQIIDIGKSLDLAEIEPYPVKIFGNILTGKLAEKDVVLVMTKNIFSLFSQGARIKRISKETNKKEKVYLPSILEKVARLAAFESKENPFSEKKLKEILKNKEKELLINSGLCLICYLTKEQENKKSKPFTYQKELERFSPIRAVQNIFSPVLSKITPWLKKLKDFIKKQPFKKESKETPKEQQKLKLASPRIIFKKPHLSFPEKIRKNAILLSLFILILAAGFFIFKKEEQSRLEEYRATLNSIRQDVDKGESYLILSENKKAFDLFKKLLEDIVPLKNEKKIQKEALELESIIEKNLKEISKFTVLENPKLFYEFNAQEFIPQKIAYFKGALYVFSPVNENVYKISQQKDQTKIEMKELLSDAAGLDNSLVFLKKPNSVYLLENDKFDINYVLNDPYPDFTLKKIVAFGSNLYAFDEKNGEVIKYPGPLKEGKDTPQIWLEVAGPKAKEGLSMAIDTSVWILNKDNTISRYYKGALKEKFEPSIFPYPKGFSEITLSTNYVYLLEPGQKRVVILNKAGQVVKQFQSEKFDNIKDFTVSANGTVWLLNGTQIYQLPLF